MILFPDENIIAISYKRHPVFPFCCNTQGAQAALCYTSRSRSCFKLKVFNCYYSGSSVDEMCTSHAQTSQPSEIIILLYGTERVLWPWEGTSRAPPCPQKFRAWPDLGESSAGPGSMCFAFSTCVQKERLHSNTWQHTLWDISATQSAACKSHKISTKTKKMACFLLRATATRYFSKAR